MSIDTGADEGADGQWMTYDELGLARGISKESALKLALRHKWRKQGDNRGHVRVYVPAEWAGPRDIGAASGADTRAEMSRTIGALETAVSTLREQLERECGRVDQAEARTAMADARAGRAEGRAETAEARADTAEHAERQARAEVEQLRQQVTAEQAARTKAELEGLQLRQTEEARRSRGLLARLRTAWRGA